MNPKGGSFVIEVKTLEAKARVVPWFDPAIISNSQRKWLDRWYTRGGRGYLGLGTSDLGKRRLWIIPWGKWFAFENAIFGAEKIVQGVEIPKLRISVDDLDGCFKEYECEWHIIKNHKYPNSPWTLPLGHPLLNQTWLSHQAMKDEDWAALSPRYEEKEKPKK
jgi:hypothetical protein